MTAGAPGPSSRAASRRQGSGETARWGPSPSGAREAGASPRRGTDFEFRMLPSGNPPGRRSPSIRGPPRHGGSSSRRAPAPAPACGPLARRERGTRTAARARGESPPPPRRLTGPRCVLTVVAMVLRRPRLARREPTRRRSPLRSLRRRQRLSQRSRRRQSADGRPAPAPRTAQAPPRPAPSGAARAPPRAPGRRLRSRSPAAARCVAPEPAAWSRAPLEPVTWLGSPASWTPGRGSVAAEPARSGPALFGPRLRIAFQRQEPKLQAIHRKQRLGETFDL